MLVCLRRVIQFWLLHVQELESVFPNEDLSIELLSRLPAKPLLRFKCVSKGWQTIISDVSFRRTHLKTSKPIVSGFFFQEKFQWCNDDIESINYISVDSEKSSIYNTILDFLPEKVVLMASTNGLLCCRSCNHANHSLIYICNPSNKEYMTLEWAGINKAADVALVFDPVQDCLGVSTCFKLVSLYWTEAEEEDEMQSYYSFKVYSSKSREWKAMERTCLCNFSLLKNKGIFANGYLHWLTTGDKIITFDVKNEESRLIDVPPGVQCKCAPEMCIGESGGCLHYIKISEAGLENWVLTCTSEPDWKLKYSKSLISMELEYPRYLYNMAKRVTSRLSTDAEPWVNPLAFKDGLLFITVCSNVYSYNFETKRMDKLCSRDSLGPNAYASPIVLPYSMSLVPLESPIVVLT
ncbi:hypothetical protein ACHQM5_007996 [Ranunculus cassubicifolius]